VDAAVGRRHDHGVAVGEELHRCPGRLAATCGPEQRLGSAIPETDRTAEASADEGAPSGAYATSTTLSPMRESPGPDQLGCRRLLPDTRSRRGPGSSSAAGRPTRAAGWATSMSLASTARTAGASPITSGARRMAPTARWTSKAPRTSRSTGRRITTSRVAPRPYRETSTSARARLRASDPRPRSIR
jgi:hypothetical protein